MAYINPQAQIDQQQNERSDRNQAAIGNGLINGLNFVEENRRRAVDDKRKIDQISLDLAGKGASSAEIADYHATGNLNPILDRASKIAEAARIKAITDSERAARKDESIIKLNESKAKKELNTAPKMGDKEKIDYRINAQQAQQKDDEVRKANITGFEFHSPDITPTPKDAEDVKKMNSAHTNFERTAGEIQHLLGTFSPLDYTGVTSKGKLLKQKISEAQIQQKTIKDLGVLNGPDLPLINNTLGDVGSFATLATLGPDAAKARMQEAVNSSKNNLHSEAFARGYKPKGQVQQPQKQQALAPQDAQAIQWAQQNPHDPRAAQILQIHGVK